MNRNTSERKRTDAALRRMELIAASIVEEMADGVMLVEMNGAVTYVNKAVEKILGYKSEELVGTSAVALPTYRSSKDRNKARQALKIVIEKGSAEAIEMTTISKDGAEITINSRATLVKDAEGNPQTLVAVIKDVTERGKAEEALRGGEEYFKALMENSLDAVTIMNEDGTIRYESPSYERLLGFKPEERVGGGLYERIHPDDVTRVGELFAEFLQNRVGTLHTEVRAQHKDGSWRFIEAIGSNLLDNPVVKGIVVNLRDTTERKRAEEVLRQSEEKLRLYLDSSPDAIYILDAMGNFLYGNIAAQKATGYAREEIMGRNFVEIGILSDEQLLKAAQLHELNLAGKPTGPQEYELTRKDGSRVFVEISTYPVGQGDNLEVIGIARDTTERRKMESELRLLSDAVRMTTDSVAITDMGGSILDINEAGLRMYGLGDRADFVGRNPIDAIVPEDRRKALENMAKIVATGQVKGIEYHVLRKDGSRILIETSVSIIKGEDGKPKGLVAVARDITERRMMEQELAQSEAKYRSLIETAGAGVATTNLKGEFVLVNEALCNMIGYSQEELLGKNFAGFLHPHDVAAVPDLFSRGLEGSKDKPNIEFRVIHKDGHDIWCYSSPTPLVNQNETVGFNAIIYDITERKKAEEALQRSEEKFKRLVEDVNDGYLVVQDYRVVFINLRAAEMFGYTKEEVVGRAVPEFLSPELIGESVERYQRRLRGEALTQELEMTLVRKDGTPRTVELGVRLIDYENKPAVSIIMRDITKRKRAEEALRLSEERYRLVVENASEGIVVIQDGMFKLFNDRAAELLGYSREELASIPFIELIHPDDQQMMMERHLERLKGGNAPNSYSFRVINKAGNAKWGQVNAVVVTWEGRPATLNLLTDITERKKAEEEKQRMEEQLLLAGRLAAVGELSAGVAHELNNPIAAIQGFAELLTARDDLDETTKKDLGIVYREAQRAAKITANLLSFARRHEPEKHLISLNEAMEKTLELRDHEMKVNNIEVVMDFAADLPQTMADFFQMQQVFMNIINNAEQAMLEAHGKGRLVVKTQKVGNMIQISFSDDGPGISEENIKRIFDPFFTTKEVGKGTGLGLSICYGLVEAHGGHIYAQSKLGEGATFVVEIPITSEGQ